MQKYKDMITATKTEKKKQETKEYKHQLKTIEKRIAELHKMLNKIYEN